MAKHVRGVDELQAHLEEQRGFLRRSSAAYDLGERSEAKRLATTVYILCHDGTGRTKSLLGQLGIKSNVEWISSVHPIDEEVFPKTYLAAATFYGGTLQFRSNFTVESERGFNKRLGFSKWWDEPVFQAFEELVPGKPYTLGRSISRKNLVFHLRSQDGGAHVDGELSNFEYTEFSQTFRTGLEFRIDDGPYAPIPHPHLATMRQIAWEVEETLKDVPGGPILPTREEYDELAKNPPERYRSPVYAAKVEVKVALGRDTPTA